VEPKGSPKPALQVDSFSSGMVLVEGGAFQMGNTRGDSEGDEKEKPVHTVTLTYDFWIGITEVTFDQYDEYCLATGKRQPSDWGWGRGSRPVINVSWWDAIRFCNWLSEKEGREVAYDMQGNLLDGTGKRTHDITQVRGYRLPTEAEWEYAARGGQKSTMDFKYAGSNNLSSVGWYWQNSGDHYLRGDDNDWDWNKIETNQGKTHPVGVKSPNELGLYDMSGSVWEWCYDWHDSSWYKNGNQINPIGPSTPTSQKIDRGGGWYSFALDCRVADRGSTPIDTKGVLGFRLCRTN